MEWLLKGNGLKFTCYKDPHVCQDLELKLSPCQMNWVSINIFFLNLWTFLFQICAELNNPSLGPVKAWSGHRGAWTCITAYSEDKQGQVIAWTRSLFCSFVVMFTCCYCVPPFFLLPVTVNWKLHLFPSHDRSNMLAQWWVH